MKDLAGKTAFVVGASTGIGLGIARALCAAGMKVAIGSRSKSRLDGAVRRLEELGGTVRGWQVDATNREGMARAADEVEQVFGKVHVLCNNVGAGVSVAVSQATYNDWDWAISANIGSVINGLRAFLPRICSHGEGGHIVSTSSMAGLMLGRNAGVYATTKYAVVGMMEALRADLEPLGIGVSVFCPGVVNTHFFESEEGRPAQFAEPGRTLSADAKVRIRNDILAACMDPDEAGQRVVDGIRNDHLYILSHPEYEPGLRQRFEAILASMPVEDAPPERRSAEESISLLSHWVYARELGRRLPRREEAGKPMQHASSRSAPAD